MSNRNEQAASQPAVRREPLLRRWQLLLVALVALLALVLLSSTAAPISNFFDRPDHWTVQYLRLLVAVRPHDVGLKLQLVQVLLTTGHAAEARQLLSTAVPTDVSTLRWAAWLRLRVDLALFTQSSKPAERAAQVRAGIAQAIEALLREPLSASELAGLAANSLTIGRPDLAGMVYLRLIDADPAQRSKWLLLAAQHQDASGHPAVAGLLYDRLARLTLQADVARRYCLHSLRALISADQGSKALTLAGEYLVRFPADRELLEIAAKLALANQQPALAAQYYQRIADRTQDPATQRRFGRLALLALIASNQGDAALHYAGQLLDKLPLDEELLSTATKLAMGNGKPRLAQKWGRLLLQAHPQSTARISSQLAIELAAGDPHAALQLARRLVSRHPHSIHERAQLARIAEWSGQPQLALQNWVQLALQSGRRVFLDRALKMAPQLYELEQLATLLSYLAHRGRLSQSELLSLVETFEEIGEPERLVTILRDQVRRYPDHHQAWKALAEVHEHRGDLPGAIKTLEQISRNSGSSLAELTHRAGLLWELHKPSEAYVLLRDVLDHAGLAGKQPLLNSAVRGRSSEHTPPSTEDSPRTTFLRLMAHLFWLHEPRPESLDEYRQLWRQQALTIQSAGRYMYLSQTQGLHAEAISVGEVAFERFDDPEFLIAAMELAYENGRWPDLERLVQRSLQQPERFAQRRSYFTILADYYLHKGQYEGAQAAYLRLLALDPTSAMARAALLWLHIDHGNDLPHLQGKRSRSMLARLLTKWRGVAKSEPAMWLPFATGWAMLGRSQQAVDWYQREWTSRPRDHLWLLGSVSALDAVSRSSDAHRLRRFALEKLRPDALRAAHRGTTGAERELLKAYVDLVRDLYGPGKGSRWLAAVLHRDLDPIVRRGLLATWRSQGQGSESSEWIVDSSSIPRTNPWGRFQVPAKPSQDPHQISLTDVGALPDDAAEPAPAPLLALAEDTSADERPSPTRSLWVRAETAVLTVNDLLLASASLSLLLARGAWALGSQLAIHQLFLDAGNDPQAAATAISLEGRALFRHRLGRLDVGLGVDLRRDGSLITAYASESFRLWRGSTLQLGLQINEPVADTRWLRIYAARHRASLGLNTSFLGNGILNVQANFFHYHTRIYEPLSAGLNADLDIGYRLRRVRPIWTLRATASYTRNFLLSDQQPTFGATSRDALPLVDVLPQDFAALGIGSRVEHRFPGTNALAPGRLRYMADVWVGWLWPLNIPTFELRGGLVLALPRKHEIGLTGFVANNRWLGPGVINTGVGLSYLFR